MDSSWLQFEARIVARRPRLEIALSGDLDVLSVQELRPIALGLAEAEQQDVLLDLADVAFIDVAGAHGLKT